MRRDANTRRKRFTAVPAQVPEETRSKLAWERIIEAALIAATVASMLVLSTALQHGLERYTIAAM
jgi:hypothetical protein